MIKTMLEKIKKWPSSLKDYFLSVREEPKKIIVPILIILVILLSLWLITKIFSDDAEKFNYDVLVIVKKPMGADKNSKSRLEVGDVLLTKKGETIVWSKGELGTYLILKMNLSKEQAEKLTMPIDRELSKEEKEKELEKYKKAIGEDVVDEESLVMYKEELDNRRITIKQRQYHIDLEEFEDFNPKDLRYGQPYPDEIFDWKIVDKKK